MKHYGQIIQYLSSQKEFELDIAKIISEQIKFPMPIVKKGIKQGQLIVNNKPLYHTEISVRPETIVKFQNVRVDLSKYVTDNEFDKFIDLVLEELSEVDLSDIKFASRKPFCAYIIVYFANNSLEKVVDSNSRYFHFVITELESFYKDYFKEIRDIKIPRRKELIEMLVNDRNECFNELFNLVTNLTDGVFSSSLYKFLQEYTKIINKNSFQNSIAPILSSSLYSRSAIDALIKPINDSRSKKEIDEKFIHFDANKNVYSYYLDLIDNGNDLTVNLFKKIGTYLFELFKEECQAGEVKLADVKINSTAKKYNFSNTDRSEYDLFLHVYNEGEGLARDVQITSQSDIFQFDPYKVGILKPDDSREVFMNARVVKEVQNPTLTVKCSWVDLAGAYKKKTIDVIFGIQNANIPWDELERSKPYTIQEIEKKEKLYGRDEILRELEQNILSNIIESYKIWGQKRVGKSSIVKTLRSLFTDKEKIIVIWRSIAGLKNVDPILTLNTLGESICSEIFEEIDRKVAHPGIKESLRAVMVPEFNGSLSPLEIYIKKLKRIDTDLRFVFIIDEFDRINEEFFLPGNLGDSFSLNIGKGLNSLNYVGFILVGSENMHLLDRQEMNYNNFQNREVDTFDRQREFESFRKIVTGPVSPHINYTDEAVEKIYEVTNGNPYFANLICSNILNISFKHKDNEVDINTVLRATSIIVESYQKSHFEHFWADGITEESTAKKERKADIRRRLLVSYSFCFFQSKIYPTKAEIVRNFRKPLEYDIEGYEIENTITEFYNRKIFFDHNHVIRIKPSLFEMWLCGPGRTLMIEGVSDLEALQREKKLEAEHSLKQDELERISNSLVFKGEKIKIPELINYFNQFGSPFEQRRIYNLLDRIYYISKNEIMDFIKAEQKNIFRKSELTIKSEAKSPYRENVEIFSFSDTLDENKEVFDTFKTFSLIRRAKTLKNIGIHKDVWKNNGADDIIIFESIIDDFSVIQADLKSFLDEKILIEKIPVKLVALVITSKAKADLIKATSGIPNFKLIHYKEIEESKIKPFVDTTEVFEAIEESRYAFAEVRKHCYETSKESLNILFETHCPGKSIPVYWYSTKQFKSLFPNPTGVIYKREKQEDREVYRDRVYQANKELIQTINPFLVDYIKKKARKDGKEDWFALDYVPKAVMEKIFQKWMEEGSSSPKETYFDLIHYKELIKKHSELLPLFEIKEEGGDKLKWIDKVNELRRDPAHPEKPPPTSQQAEYFEQKKNEVIRRISTYKISTPDYGLVDLS